MKKLLWVSVMVLLMTVPVYAQDSEGGGSGPSPGELLFEITASPFDRDGFGDKFLSFGQLRGRYYLSDMLVPRLGIFYNVDNNGQGGGIPDVVTTITDFTFAPGVEYHFLNEGGFTSYAALDILLTGRSSSRESTTSEQVIGGTRVPQGNNDPNVGTRGFFGWGAYGAVGADYHFSSRFYLGVEIGASFISGRSSDVEVDGALYSEGIKFFQSGITTTNSLRVGFKLF